MIELKVSKRKTKEELLPYKFTPEIHNKLVDLFDGRAKEQGWKKTSKQYKERQLEFFVGAIALMDTLNGNTETSSITPRMYFTLLRGEVQTKILPNGEAEPQPKKEKIMVVPSESPVDRRDRVITEMTELVKKAWPDDNDMLDGLIVLTSKLKAAPISLKFIKGLDGFLVWSKEHAESPQKVASTLLHDLNEFAQNRDKNWFSPRTENYKAFAR